MQVVIFALLEVPSTEAEWPKLISYHATKAGAEKAKLQWENEGVMCYLDPLSTEGLFD